MNPTPPRSWKKRTRTNLAAGAALLALALVSGAAMSAKALQPALQQRGVPMLRTVSGHVQSKGGGPAEGAIVYLKDTKTLAVKSFIADDQGEFHFGQLGQSEDYEVYAELKGKRSNTKKISGFDSHNDFNFTLIVP